MSAAQAAAPRRSLRRKLLLIVMIATCAALLLSATALLLYELHGYRKAVEADLRSQAELLGQSIAPTLLFDDRKAAADALAALDLRPNVRAAALYANDGALFAAYAADGEATPPRPPPGIGEAIRIDGPQLVLSHRVARDGEILGTLVIVARHQVAERLRGYLMILLGTSGAGLALAWLIYRRLHPTITRPLHALAAAAQRVTTERDFDVRVVRSSDDEIGTLVDAFNRMLDELSREMQERRLAEAALRDADRRKDEFLATLAHELRNPLAPLRNGLQILRSAEAQPALRQRALQIMERQLVHMVRLIDDLLDVSRITRGRLELRLATVDGVAVARQAIDAVQALIDARRHRLQTSWPDGPAWVRADSARLAQVLVNLLGNAAKYTPEGGLLRLALERDDGTLRIAVHDNGIGIAAQDLESIFELFVQVDRSLERGLTGLGIGLTIVRQLVELHGGRVEARSEGLGRGSSFIVTLPLAPPPAAEVPAAAPTDRAAEAAPAIALDVLIADDNADFAESFASLLAQEGHRTRVRHDGRAALDAALESPPDVAFVDIGLPGLNGYRVAQQLRQHAATRGVLLVAVTGWAQPADRQLATEAGFDLHWVKPIDSGDAISFLRTQAQRLAAQKAPAAAAPPPPARPGPSPTAPAAPAAPAPAAAARTPPPG